MTDQENTEDENGGWDPQPAQLREGERRDISSHAAGNIEQIRQAEAEGVVDEAEAEQAVERIVERDQEGEDDAE